MKTVNIVGSIILQVTGKGLSEGGRMMIRFLLLIVLVSSATSSAKPLTISLKTLSVADNPRVQWKSHIFRYPGLDDEGRPNLDYGLFVTEDDYSKARALLAHPAWQSMDAISEKCKGQRWMRRPRDMKISLGVLRAMTLLEGTEFGWGRKIADSGVHLEPGREGIWIVQGSPKGTYVDFTHHLQVIGHTHPANTKYGPSGTDYNALHLSTSRPNQTRREYMLEASSNIGHIFWSEL